MAANRSAGRDVHIYDANDPTTVLGGLILFRWWNKYDAVRQRDRRFVITGDSAENARGSWAGFEAAHIFPLAYEGYWKEHNYGRWISIHPNNGGSINSVQNGLLLRADLHILFDTYDVSINPDFGNDECRPVDELLRWHFRQAVLANMRGAGEPVFEVDFPPGSDVIIKVDTS
ncbi:hypothetical protein EV426DRAFT_642349 [Tirmania nivea]|nr:hypothetical protein EV426DRAFT_642349 [Tirmania nivea]